MKVLEKIKISSITSFILVTIIIYLGIRLYSQEVSLKKISNSNKILIQNTISSFLDSYQVLRLFLPCESFTNCGPDDKTLMSLISEKGIAIGLWYPSKLCHDCYSQELEIFKNYSNVIGNDLTFILTNAENPRTVYNFQKTNKIRCRIYNSMNNPSEFDEINEPLIFIIGTDLHIEKPLKIRTSSEIVLIEYFKYLSKVLLPFNDNNN